MALAEMAPRGVTVIDTDDAGITIRITGREVLVKVNPDGNLVSCCGDRGVWIENGVRPVSDD